ncbi:MAG: MFS transporter [Bacillota bacterium]|nr:MFS transporter [Bacillota bacterium]
MNKGNTNRWIILITGMIILLFLGLIYGWSIFRAPLSEFYPEWNTSQLSMAFTISMIFFCLGGFFSGLLLKKVSHKVILTTAAAVLFIGFFGVSMLDTGDSGKSLLMLYMFYGVLGGGGVGLGYNCVISTVNKWFADKAGLASGVMMMGFGLGGIVLGGIVDVLIGNVGLFATFKILAVSIAVILIAGVLLLKTPDVKAQAAKVQGFIEEENFSPTQMMKKASFWFFVLWCILLNSAGLLVINNAATIAVAFGAPAVLGLIVSVCNGAGRVVIGEIFDRTGRKTSMLLNTIFVCAAGVFLLLGDMSSAAVVIIIGLLFTGLGYGGTPTLSSAFIMKQFGPKYYPVNFSICNFSLIPAAIVGPMVSSRLIDSSGGAYTSSFIMMIVLAGLAGVAWMMVNKFTASDRA